MNIVALGMAAINSLERISLQKQSYNQDFLLNNVILYEIHEALKKDRKY